MRALLAALIGVAAACGQFPDEAPLIDAVVAQEMVDAKLVGGSGVCLSVHGQDDPGKVLLSRLRSRGLKLRRAARCQGTLITVGRFTWEGATQAAVMVETADVFLKDADSEVVLRRGIYKVGRGKDGAWAVLGYVPTDTSPAPGWPGAGPR